MKLIFLKSFILFLFLPACSSVIPSYDGIEASLFKGRFEKAVRKVEKVSGSYSKRSRLLYDMDRLLTAHLAGQYRTSNVYAEKAHRRMDALVAKSISGEILSFAINDTKKDYAGEHFEQILVHLFSLLNYGMLGNPEEALVEARRADLKFKEHHRVTSGQISYDDDALMRWLAGVMYEAQGEADEAFLDYKKSLEAFKHYEKNYGTNIPAQVIADVRRLAKKLGEKSSLRKLKKDFPQFKTPSQQTGEADLIALVYDSLAPRKHTALWQVPVSGQETYFQYYVVAYPRYESPPVVLDKAFIEMDDGSGYPLVLFEDIQSIAQVDLKERMGRIKAKAIARATSKFVLARQIQKKQKNEGEKFLAGLLTNLFTVTTEKADTRSWRTLPGRIYAARVRLKAGSYSPSIRLLKSDGGEAVRRFGAVELKKGVPAFIRASVY